MRRRVDRSLITDKASGRTFLLCRSIRLTGRHVFGVASCRCLPLMLSAMPLSRIEVLSLWCRVFVIQ